jgi:hypothetical protein
MQIPSRYAESIFRLVSWPNLIGLDAPIVAICWQEMFARVLDVYLPWVIHLILGLSTWCIYLADRIHDVIRTQNRMATPRHDFTQRHLRKLIALLVLISFLNLFLIVRHVPQKLLITGCITLEWVGVYYCVRLTRLKHFISLVPREWMCGMLFALGCAIAPQSYGSDSFMRDPTLVLSVIMFGMICSANCIMISIWEEKPDEDVSDLSIVKTHKQILPYLSFALMILCVASIPLAYLLQWQVFGSIALSAAFLKMIDHYQQRLSPLNRRVLADAVLLTPLMFFAG